MNLSTVVVLAGGPGSGCNPAVGKCGRPEGPSKDDIKWTRYAGYSALSSYQQNTHSHINRWLREGSPEPKTIAQQDSSKLVEALDKAFAMEGAHSVTAKDMIVYRGIASERLFKKFSKGGGKGQLLRDKAFMSTSRSEEIARKALYQWSYDEKGIVLAIRLPKGTPYLSARLDEKEMLLNRNTKVKVTSVYKVGEPIIVYADYVRKAVK